jgi:sec-independent protein translocase protein TatA
MSRRLRRIVVCESSDRNLPSRKIKQGQNMGTFSAWHWLIVSAILLLLFGRGKIPQLMADLGRGISEFKKGMRDPEDGNNPDTTGTDVR